MIDVAGPVELEHFRVRLRRAKTHFENFGETWADYLKLRPHGFITHVDSNGNGTLRVRRDVPIPPELGLIVGEFAYQLRAALDNCLYAAAIIDSGSNPPPGGEQLQWPICDTPAAWKNSAGRYQHLSDELVHYLESMQPYHTEFPGWNCLRILHDMARIDRHRTLHVVALYPAEAKIWYNSDVVDNVQMHPGVIHEGDVLVTFEHPGNGPLTPEHIDGEFEFDVELAGVVEVPGPNGLGRPYRSLDRRLRALYEVTVSYMETLIHGAQHPGALAAAAAADDS